MEDEQDTDITPEALPAPSEPIPTPDWLKRVLDPPGEELITVW